jgi:membrane protease subunit HflK
VQDIFRDDRAGIAKEVQSITQNTLDGYGMGVQINGIAIENAAPPAEVADAFEEVQRAEQDQSRFQQEAQQYANTLLGNSRGQAAKMREDAAAYKDRVVKEAQGEAARFTSVYDAYVKAPDVTRKRLYLETLEGILSTSQKVVLDKDASGSGVLPYLPLPQLKPSTIAPPAGSGTNGSAAPSGTAAGGTDSSGGSSDSSGQTLLGPAPSSTGTSQ